MKKYEVIKDGKKINIEMKLEYKKIVYAYIDGKKYNLAFSGDGEFTKKIGGDTFLVSKYGEFSEKQYYIIDDCLKLKKDIAKLTNGNFFWEVR